MNMQDFYLFIYFFLCNLELRLCLYEWYIISLNVILCDFPAVHCIFLIFETSQQFHYEHKTMCSSSSAIQTGFKTLCIQSPILQCWGLELSFTCLSPLACTLLQLLLQQCKGALLFSVYETQDHSPSHSSIQACVPGRGPGAAFTRGCCWSCGYSRCWNPKSHQDYGESDA